MNISSAHILSDKILFCSEMGQPQLALLVKAVLENSTEGIEMADSAKPYMSSPMNMGMGDGEVNSGVVAIYPIQDIISKYSTWRAFGSEFLLSVIMENEQNPDVLAHVLDINSPGGEAYFTGVFAEAIRNEVQKPIIAHVNGLCCSAAYYLAAGCDEVYCSENTDIIGSIGTMFSMIDMKPMFEKMGIKFHDIYAPQSTEKNQTFIEAKKGKYELIKEKLLSPFADAFIQSVRNNRPQISDDGHVFAGAEYTAKNALEIGLIDGIMTLDKVVAYAAQKGSKKTKIVNSKKENSMSFLKNFMASLTGEVQADEVKAGATLAAQLDTLTAENAALTEKVGVLSANIDNLIAQAQTAADLQAQVNALTIERDAVSAELLELKAKPRAGALTPPMPTGWASDEKVIPESLKAAAAALNSLLD
jgi:protease-4